MHGRAEEQRLVDGLLADALDGRSAVLLVRGAPGVGKTRLLEYAASAAAESSTETATESAGAGAGAGASGIRVIRGTGIEFEAELPFAGLHALLHPVLDRLAVLPAAQADALRAAFGLGPAEPRDRFLVGLAVLSLLAELAGDGALLCVLDDAQWLDRASIEALAFAARRLTNEGVLLLLGARDDGADSFRVGLPELSLRALDRSAATTLLAERDPDLADNVRERILAESDGNPLALIELPTVLTDRQRAGDLGPAAPHAALLPLPERVRDAFGVRMDRLPDPARTFLLVAACEETGDIDVVSRAAGALGADPCAVEAAERSGLLRRGPGGVVVFRHPLARAAVVHGASARRRRAAHRALADALLGDRAASEDAADRRAWHLAGGRWAGRADRGGLGGGRRSGAATRRIRRRDDRSGARRRPLPVPESRARRLVAAAEAALAAGEPRRAAEAAGQAGRIDRDDPLLGARIARVRATVEFEDGSPARAARLLVAAAAALGAEYRDQAAGLLMEAVRNSYFAGDPELARDAADRLGAIAGDSAFARALDGLAHLLAGDAATALPAMRALSDSVLAGAGIAHGPGERLIAGSMGMMTGDDEASWDILDALVADARAGGLVGWSAHLLEHLAVVEGFLGRHRDARAHAEEGLALADSIGQAHRVDHLRCVLAWHAAIAGDDRGCRDLAEPAVARATERGIVRTSAWGVMALGLLDLSLGRVEHALDRLETASLGRVGNHLGATFFAPDQVEAAARSGQPARAAEPLARFERWAAAAGRPWSDAVALRCRALLAPSRDAGRLYAEAVALHHRGGRPFERARTELLYGEWLRREHRKAEARSQLRAALEAFERLGALPWGERARAELRATGVSTSTRPPESVLDRLTPQELQVVRLAAEGLSNRDIASQLFLSPRTIGYHLYKAYPKLGITSRVELATLGPPASARG
ncbi:LuxR C-terminal-related transcriptional regulator [Embleya sp. NBC_00896]|uniref:helix-turn-helix transcriptional regulator n=1 Tax=Embleya sp. NBC_00896 TaxID=2975961 RepID=UPI002F916EC0